MHGSTNAARFAAATGCAIGLMLALPAQAQQAGAPPQPVAEPAALVTAAPASACCTIPANTHIAIEIVNPISSKTAQIGETFAIRLFTPIMIDGRVLVPSGTPGGGQVVHAAKAKGGGKAGELILAARYLDYNGVRIPLRALQLSGSGKDKTGTAIAVSALAGATGGLVGFIMTGGNKNLEAGAIGDAKISSEIVIAPPGEGGAPAPAPAPVATTTS